MNPLQYALTLLLVVGCGKEQDAPARAGSAAAGSAPAGPRHVCPSIATGSLGGASAPAPLVAMFDGIPEARILDRGYDDAMDGAPGFSWSAGTLDPSSGDPPEGGLTLEAARARLAQAAPGAKIEEETSGDNRAELSVQLPSAPTHRSSMGVSAFYSDVRVVTFTCIETRTDLQPPTLGELNDAGAVPVDLPPGLVDAIGQDAVVRRLEGRVGLNLTLEPDRDRPRRIGAALEAAGFSRQGEGPGWSFERRVEGQRHSAMLAGNGGMVTLMLGGLHSTFTYR